MKLRYKLLILAVAVAAIFIVIQIMCPSTDKTMEGRPGTSAEDAKTATYKPAADAPRNQDTPKAENLDFSKPIFTRDHALVCPASLLSDPRKDHGPKAIHDAYTSVFSRSSKARALGCEEWQGDLQVYAAPLKTGNTNWDFVSIALTPNPAGLITMTSELTNKEITSHQDMEAKEPSPSQPAAPADPVAPSK
jgi:hypothetical protein